MIFYGCDVRGRLLPISWPCIFAAAIPDLLFRYTSIGTRANTVPNPLLLDQETGRHLPAHLLQDGHAERLGRSKRVHGPPAAPEGTVVPSGCGESNGLSTGHSGSNGYCNGHSNGYSNGHSTGHSSNRCNGHSNGWASAAPEDLCSAKGHSERKAERA